jgi:hypothetical protein
MRRSAPQYVGASTFKYSNETARQHCNIDSAEEVQQRHIHSIETAQQHCNSDSAEEVQQRHIHSIETAQQHCNSDSREAILHTNGDSIEEIQNRHSHPNGNILQRGGSSQKQRNGGNVLHKHTQLLDMVEILPFTFPGD